MAMMSSFDPNNPLLARVQAALEKQLVEANQRVEEEIKEKAALVRQLVTQRESMGAKMYTFQQQLIKLHSNIDKAETQQREHAEKRFQTEEKAKQIQAELQERQASMAAEKRTLDQDLEKLNGLHMELRQVEGHKADLVANVKLKERAALKANEDASTHAKRKLEQDLLVDKLSEELKALQDRLGVLDSRIQAQKSESNESATFLAEVTAGMQDLQMQKTRRMHEWQTNLTNLARINETVRKFEQQITEKRANLLNLDNELNGFKLREKAEHDTNEQHTATLNKVKNEDKFLDQRIAANEDGKQKLAMEFSRMQKASELMEKEYERIEKEHSSMKNKAASLQKEGDRIVTQAVKLEEKIAEIVQSQKTHEKSSTNTQADVGRLLEDIQQRFVERMRLQNELAQVNIDILNITAHTKRLQAALQQALDDVRAKDELVGRYEADIRRQNDEIERKQSEVDRLNRKLEQLRSKNEDENTGPLEATIHNLTNEIALKVKDCVEIQNYWLRSQTELVALQRQSHELQEDIQSHKAHRGVLEQKLLRVQDAISLQLKEKADLEHTMGGLQLDLEKLNVLITKHEVKKHALSEDNLALSAEARAQIQDYQKEINRLEAAIEACVQEEEAIFLALLELEQEAMQWEKKIQLWRETQNALDPTVGASETEALRKEVHNMQVKYDKLKKAQDVLIQEMEKAVERRGHVLIRGLAQSKPQGPSARLMLQKQVDDLTKKIKQAKSEISAMEQSTRQVQEEIAAMQQMAGSLEEKNGISERSNLLAQQQIEQLAMHKQKQFKDLTRYQQVVKRASTKHSAAYFSNEHAKADARGNKVEQLYTTLALRFPQLADEFRGDPDTGPVATAART
eukprot:TRINITY_DN17554_c0_g1_i1.p1 TRINITY_DN17554_c0_g1~~TRINITY_DN17554_c0_g1_i1.p1  ORF type:complete len:899 (+),score=365.52 TRINITY_DN17554_c0_g1_i1:129-2699(+)